MVPFAKQNENDSADRILLLEVKTFDIAVSVELKFLLDSKKSI